MNENSYDFADSSHFIDLRKEITENILFFFSQKSFNNDNLNFKIEFNMQMTNQTQHLLLYVFNFTKLACFNLQASSSFVPF